jgi:hypothetical protein
LALAMRAHRLDARHEFLKQSALGDPARLLPFRHVASVPCATAIGATVSRMDRGEERRPDRFLANEYTQFAYDLSSESAKLESLASSLQARTAATD